MSQHLVNDSGTAPVMPGLPATMKAQSEGMGITPKAGSVPVSCHPHAVSGPLR